MSRTSSTSSSSASNRAIGLALALVAGGTPLALPAQVLDTIVVDNRNVFDASEEEMLGFVAKLANALHIRTRASVIRRSLLVGPGDSYDSARVAESERALRALNVFRLVALDTVRLKRGLALRVVTADGWSTKPQAGFTSVGGDLTWEIGLVEQNFLGTASALAASYRDTPDRNILEFLYWNPHFVARRVVLLGRYADLSDGRRGSWFIGVPFYHTAARRALVSEGEAARERVLVFRDGALAMTPERRTTRVGVSGGVAAVATSRDFVRLWVGAQWRREDFAPDTTSVFPRSTFGTVGAGVDLGHVRFRVLEHFNTYARREDVDLSQTLSLGLWAAPRAWGYGSREAGVGPVVRGQVSAVWRGGFAVLRGEGNGVFGAAGLDSGRVRGRITVASQNLVRQSLVLHGEVALAQRMKPGGEFDLWLEQRGPRLFGAHAFTGTHMVWVALEDRILLQDEAWGLVGVGLAPFLDWGGAWYADEGARLGGNVGLALRLGPTHAVRGEVAELAVGYRFGDGLAGRRWAVTLRKGFEF